MEIASHFNCWSEFEVGAMFGTKIRLNADAQPNPKADSIWKLQSHSEYDLGHGLKLDAKVELDSDIDQKSNVESASILDWERDFEFCIGFGNRIKLIIMSQLRSGIRIKF